MSLAKALSNAAKKTAPAKPVVAPGAIPVDLITFPPVPPLRVTPTSDDCFVPVATNMGYELRAREFARMFISPPANLQRFDLGYELEVPDGCIGLVIPPVIFESWDGLTVLQSTIEGKEGAHVVCRNLTDREIRVNRGDVIGRLIVVPCLQCEVELTAPVPSGDGVPSKDLALDQNDAS